MTYTDEHIRLWVQNCNIGQPALKKSATIIRELMEQRDKAQVELFDARVALGKIQAWVVQGKIISAHSLNSYDSDTLLEFCKKGLGE